MSTVGTLCGAEYRCVLVRIPPVVVTNFVDCRSQSLPEIFGGDVLGVQEILSDTREHRW